VSEQILNGTSAQISYTVPFTSVHAGKYGQKTNQTAKQNYPGSVISYDTRPGNEVGLFNNAPEPTRGNRKWLGNNWKKRLGCHCNSPTFNHF